MAQHRRHAGAIRRSAPSSAWLNRTIQPGWTSNNWSGYAIQRRKRGSFYSISGCWTVPRIKPGKTNRYASSWIGIDGYTNSALIQTGTEQEVENGKTVYYPWWEILPNTETRIAYPVSPLDNMYAKITRLSKRKWMIVLANKTKGWVFKTIQRYTGPGQSAEWIMEAPTNGGSIAILANYGTITFRRCRVNGRPPGLRRTDRGIMVQNGRTVSTPSLPGKGRDNFTIAYGSRIPRPPKQGTCRFERKRLSPSQAGKASLHAEVEL